MSVSNGQQANESTFNGGFASLLKDNQLAGKQKLNNANSATIDDLQKCINTIMAVIGMSELAENNGDYENNNYVTDGDSRKVAISKLDGAVKALADIVAQIQKPIFENLGLKKVTNGGTIELSTTAGIMFARVEGETGAVTFANAPFGAAPAIKNGSIIILIGNDDTKTVGINYANVAGGPLLNGDRVLNKGASVIFIWEETIGRLIPLGG